MRHSKVRFTDSGCEYIIINDNISKLSFLPIVFTTNMHTLAVGPDFLDAMHHEAAIDAARGARKNTLGSKPSRGRRRKTINLDGWMMGGETAVLDCFLRHCGRSGTTTTKDDDDDDDDVVDVCIIEVNIEFK